LSDDAQPSVDKAGPSSQDPDGFSTYGENDMVPEPHRVSRQPCWSQPANHNASICDHRGKSKALTLPGVRGSIPCPAQLVEQGMNSARVRGFPPHSIMWDGHFHKLTFVGGGSCQDGSGSPASARDSRPTCSEFTWILHNPSANPSTNLRVCMSWHRSWMLVMHSEWHVCSYPSYLCRQPSNYETLLASQS